MRNKTIILISIAFMAAVASCGPSQSEYKELIAERDSLRQASTFQASRLDSYVETVEVLNATLDSIAVHENMIFLETGEKPITKEDVQRNLMRFETILLEQTAKIRRLEAQLATSQDENSKSLQLIAHLKRTIEEKNAQIAQLQSELEKKDFDIAQLRGQVETQTATINELNVQTKRQGEALARQDAMLNNGYVLIGSKKDLKRKGITRRGKLVTNAILDRSKFYQVDIRKWTEISFQAKRPKILTNMPTSSYELTTSGKGDFTLRVINPTDFWKISNYLVIQTD